MATPPWIWWTIGIVIALVLIAVVIAIVLSNKNTPQPPPLPIPPASDHGRVWPEVSYPPVSLPNHSVGPPPLQSEAPASARSPCPTGKAWDIKANKCVDECNPTSNCPQEKTERGELHCSKDDNRDCLECNLGYELRIPQGESYSRCYIKNSHVTCECSCSNEHGGPEACGVNGGWCYVNGGKYSNCPNKTQSTDDATLWWSRDACGDSQMLCNPDAKGSRYYWTNMPYKNLGDTCPMCKPPQCGGSNDCPRCQEVPEGGTTPTCELP